MNDTTTIHVRFAPNGDVSEIDERPGNLTAQQWFDLLVTQYPEQYQTFMGGRAIFRLPKATLDQIKAALAKESA
jgi:hypothetical protein